VEVTTLPSHPPLLGRRYCPEKFMDGTGIPLRAG